MAQLRVFGDHIEGGERVLTAEALAFVYELERRFRPVRDQLVDGRRQRYETISSTGSLDFLPETAEVRSASWQVAPAPRDLADRRVEITGPTDRKMAINALNSGARVWLADFEDANAPTWANVVGGQVSLFDAVRGALAFRAPEGKEYAVTAERPATVVVRPRGWHLDEVHLRTEDQPVTGALVDFGLYFFHNAQELLSGGSGPYFYLPKLESHAEARLWNDVFTFAQEALSIPHGSVRATVLIETVTAAFEMDEILFELREHASGLNAGRWDYLFSIIKNFRSCGDAFVLPDRNSVTMTAPFMRSYTELLVRTCHDRGAHAIGGMAAFIPNRRDPEVTNVALEKVRADKEREAGDGFDGSWVAHPDLVPICDAAFSDVLGSRPHQIERRRSDVSVTAGDLLDISSTKGEATPAGLENNVSVALRYLEAWLRGNGAVALYDLMEDVATAEIARSQIWQWLQNEVRLSDGTPVVGEVVSALADQELARIEEEVGAQAFAAGRWTDARKAFDRLTITDSYVDFLTYETYGLLD